MRLLILMVLAAALTAACTAGGPSGPPNQGQTPATRVIERTTGPTATALPTFTVPPDPTPTPTYVPTATYEPRPTYTQRPKATTGPTPHLTVQPPGLTAPPDESRCLSEPTVQGLIYRHNRVVVRTSDNATDQQKKHAAEAMGARYAGDGNQELLVFPCTPGEDDELTQFSTGLLIRVLTAGPVFGQAHIQAVSAPATPEATTP